ncbi:tyrosine recombinase XerC [Paraliobacillus ryukyuensis]|uniref:Site-specific recombinase XerD n=1 Tax=Paraliobacillus ryukyuensis TaxID=200904 RepID=A0A366DM16_9BACI|nr:site-specific integrase [Paraliobacillus ryukyuensis]RBO91133.1 site-specific recombinase XerD [Paraliobacillus ryukyuensis]
MAKGHMRDRGNGKWQLEVDLGYYVDPKTGNKRRHKKYRTIQTNKKREAETELTKFVSEVTGDDYYEPEKMNFVDFVVNEWLPKHAKRHLSSTTLSTHITYLELRIIPAFQYLRLDQIKPKHIIDFIDNLQNEGMHKDGGKLASSTVFYHFRILNNLFNFAREMQLIKNSPLDGIKKPKVDYKEIEVYTIEEASELIKALETEVNVPHWQIIVKLAITTGMRRSELFGLEFKHIDFDKGIVHVRQALTYTKYGGYDVHEIKKGTRAARRRDVYISDTLLKQIEQLESSRKKERFAKGKSNLWRNGEHNFILADENSKPFNPASMKNWWKRFLQRHNLKYINIHALRHTSATLLINEGVHAKIISQRLGHSDISTTMNIYGHAIEKADKLASEKLDQALLGNNKSQ